MAGNKDTRKAALSSGPLAISKTHPRSKNPKNTTARKQSKTPARRRRGERFLRFREAEGKTVEFVEMYTDQDFPCVEIGFADKTALHFVIDARLTMEPTYANWKTGNMRLLRQWPAVECR